jgi:hypothetical protein
MRYVQRAKFMYLFKALDAFLDIKANGVYGRVRSIHGKSHRGFVANVRVNCLDFADLTGPLVDSDVVRMSDRHADCDLLSYEPLNNLTA